ncbi:glutamate--cysteine ligase [Pleionea sp. CnH1-48]|uniref:glutamate--cysteine ligase n=1 Tax=Pleionea sp. CnH1-48 TaxID=2954494 RepID=UPI002096D3FF|nr:glutamate--cysteine ligase [Pleionea sp. CnH1-48]MCO7226393.1 glutamate--cysteine ligase [Pleionea sp. CnH1-48]
MSINFSLPHESSFWSQDAASQLNGILRGLEKESLRITDEGCISQKRHPEAFGSALTHQFITTDYSEALLEFITPPTTDLSATLSCLDDVHRYVHQHLDGETLWGSSMPCVMGDEASIPLAQYGSSNSAQMKTVYRMGLGNRYGRFMQTIAGVHYNFSFPEALWESLWQASDQTMDLKDFKSHRYMGLIRNFRRHGWLIPLLFGASPALCESFLQGRPSHLDLLVPGTRYGRFATSLRMSDLGYQNNIQQCLKVSYNSLEEYVQGLDQAIRTEDPYYQQIGVLVDGEYRQLNANLLQIENEFYANIRPKRASQSGVRPTRALSEGGIEYIEVRSLDLNPFDPLGVTQDTLHFIDVLLLLCLIKPSPCITEREEAELEENLTRVVKRGRLPGVHLLMQNSEVELKHFAHELFEQLQEVAELLDKAYETSAFSSSVQQQHALIDQPEKSLSGQIVNLIEQRQDGFFPFAMELSKQHSEYFNQRPLDDEKHTKFEQEAKVSLQKQREIEQNDNKTFEEFLSDYFA